ncbi:MAG: hypothetical protein QM756_25350 [Polyangiaceae bacterium]
MRLLSWKARAFCFALAPFTLYSKSSSACPPRETLTVAEQLDIPSKVIKLRKVARKVLGIGVESHDNDPLWAGPLRVTLSWRMPWRWNDSGLQSRLPQGLRGGPTLSFDLPIERWISLETRFSSFRYVYSRTQSERLSSDELADPKDERRSLEAGLFLNVHFGGFR